MVDSLLTIPLLLLIAGMEGIEGKGYHRTYYCSLRDEPTRTILRDELGLYHDTEDSVGEGRALRLLSTRQDEMDPPFVENGYRFLSDITSIPDGTSSESSIQTDTNQHFAVKACNCFQWLVDKDPFCPADSTYCSSSINYYSNDYLIKCSRSTQLQSAARFTWKYTYFIYAFVIAIVFCSRSGHVSCLTFIAVKTDLSSFLVSVQCTHTFLRLYVSTQSSISLAVVFLSSTTG
jgi:uncharacterized membrane protein